MLFETTLVTEFDTEEYSGARLRSGQV